ncbi:hypothetical protein FRB99_006237 [Tulasnella sp. 403]|nr:hypothetical protein FRB99_006237 [Tulasnella sp. 403]
MSPSLSDSLKSFLQTIRSAKAASSPGQSTSPKFTQSPPISYDLPAPEDITSRLSEKHLPFKLARKVSQSYVEKAVDLQFHFQHGQRHHSKIISAAEASPYTSNISHLQSKLCASQKTAYKTHLQSLLNQTISLAKDGYTQPEPEETEDEEPAPSTCKLPADGTEEDEDGEGERSQANPEDEQALQNMSARASALLSMMYERGFTFPRRWEKIKLAEATGLTYRQIGIWYSNRRERNRPGRRPGSTTTPPADPALPDASDPVHDRGATIDTSSQAMPTAQMSTYQPELVGCVGFDNGAMDALQTAEDDDLFGAESGDDAETLPTSQTGTVDEAQVTSFSTSMPLESVFGQYPPPEVPSSDTCSEPWSALTSTSNSFVEFSSAPSNEMDPMTSFPNFFNFSVPTDSQDPTTNSILTSLDFPPLGFLPATDSSLLPATTPLPSIPAPTSFMNTSAEFLAGFAAGSASQFGMQVPIAPTVPSWHPFHQTLSPPLYQSAQSVAASAPTPACGSHSPIDAPNKRARPAFMRPPRTTPFSRPKTSATPIQRRPTTATPMPAPPPRTTSDNDTLPHKAPTHVPIAPRPVQPVPPANAGARPIKPMPGSHPTTVNPLLISTITPRTNRPPMHQVHRKIAPALSTTNPHGGLAVPILRPGVVHQ